MEEGDLKNEYESDVDDLVDIKRYDLHNIATRLAIFPYYDMVRWIISHTNISTCTTVNSFQVIVSSFRLDDVSNMYDMSPPTVSVDDNFIKEFIKK